MATDTTTQEAFVEYHKSEFSEPFIQGMRDRMEISFHKYGPVAEGAAKVDIISSLMTRLRKYAADGNTEWLMDVANFAMIEFMFPKHPEAHFKGTDDGESPGRTSARTGKDDKRDNATIGTNPNSRTAAFR